MPQLKIPFGISAGCEPYWCKYTGTMSEMCPGGSVFPVGEKEDCRTCASSCASCVEMVINLGFGSFDDLCHLVQKPSMLSKKYQNLLSKNKT